jgi:phosphoglycolate phosphatase
MKGKVKAILFDLDGTIIDTAPEMVQILYEMLKLYKYPLPSYKLARSYVSKGSFKLMQLGFPNKSNECLLDLQRQYLELYVSNCDDSKFFPNIRELLLLLTKKNIPWGIVTNKPKQTAAPLVKKLNIINNAACIIFGDTLSLRKPNSAQLIFASKKMSISPDEIVYIGDALNDIKAGKSAGMHTILAGYGYIEDDEDLKSWNADSIVLHTSDLTKKIFNLLNT